MPPEEFTTALTYGFGFLGILFLILILLFVFGWWKNKKAEERGDPPDKLEIKTWLET